MPTAHALLATALAKTAATTRACVATSDAANGELTASGTAPDLGSDNHAPESALSDQLGRVVRLGERLVRGPVVLIFYRGDWSPFLQSELASLQGEL
ncbi:MAG: redoxin domain-containing protein [Actinomycetota bacterium]|nr:redoxin domain-containing protein [Actinomycetota bacterium]